MLELHVTDNDVTNGTIAVGWCVDKETLQDLASRGIKDPVLVLCVAPAADPEKDEKHLPHKEYRKVVPLKDLITYIEFRSSGTNKIWGFISTSGKRSTEARWLSRGNSRNCFDSAIIDEYRCDYRYPIKDEENLIAEPLSVYVPEAVFAEEPSERERKWVNYFFTHDPLDQCEFRRRRMLAYTLQPLLFALVMTATRLIPFVLGCLIGSKSLSLKPLLYPFRYDASDGVNVMTGGSIFIRKNASGWKKYLFVPFMPVVAMLLIAASVLLIKANLIHWVLLGIIAVVLLVIGGIAGWDAFTNWLHDREQQLQSEPAWYLQEEEMKLIVCAGQKKPYKLSELPSSHRTLKLRFQDLKAKVCRPYSA